MKLFLALTFLWASSFSQNITNSKNLNSIETDVFGNIYTVSSNYKINKYTKENFKKKLEYINYEYGEISKIMVENPFRLIVFFKESQSIIFLDKNLNELSKVINLDNIFEEKITDVSNYSDLIFLFSEINKIYVFDIKRNEIVNSKKIAINNQTNSIKIFSNYNKIFVLGNSFSKVFNHELNYIYEEDKEWQSYINRLLFDNNNIYECSIKEGQTTIYKLDENFNKIKIKNISDSIFTIKKNNIISINNGLLKQHTINN